LVGIIFLTGIVNRVSWFDLLQTSIALAVAAIPEGLPIVATLTLATGMLKLSRHQVLVKKLSAVETLGSTDTICTDKTGTLTQNRIETEVVMYPGASGAVVLPGLASGSPATGTAAGGFDTIMRIAVLCSTAEVRESPD